MLDWLWRRDEHRPPDDVNVGWSYGGRADGRWGVNTMVFVADRAPRPYTNRELWILDDGTVSLEMPDGACTQWAEMFDHIAAGRVVATPPDGSLVVLNGRSPVSLSRVARLVPEWEVDAQGLAADLQDMRAAILGEPRATRVCRHAFRQYLEQPNERTRADLQITYRQVPPQMRPSILENLDESDEAIRLLLSPDLTESDREQLISYCRKTHGQLPGAGRTG